mmetsp:Transcript_19120/g.39266  ORF Transcript_19120/g.39266 Transcript_19120/m.39266 type:complete len:305 (+) Transcript_19120:1752-2666(+)
MLLFSYFLLHLGQQIDLHRSKDLLVFGKIDVRSVTGLVVLVVPRDVVFQAVRGSRVSQLFLGHVGGDVKIGQAEWELSLAEIVSRVVPDVDVFFRNAGSLGTDVRDLVVGDELVGAAVEEALLDRGFLVGEGGHQQGGNVGRIREGNLLRAGARNEEWKAVGGRQQPVEEPIDVIVLVRLFAVDVLGPEGHQGELALFRDIVVHLGLPGRFLDGSRGLGHRELRGLGGLVHARRGNVRVELYAPPVFRGIAEGLARALGALGKIVVDVLEFSSSQQVLHGLGVSQRLVAQRGIDDIDVRDVGGV